MYHAQVSTLTTNPSQSRQRKMFALHLFFCPAATEQIEAEAPNRPEALDLGIDILNRTYYPKMADAAAVNKPWYMIDAKGQTLGRLASLVAQVLR